MLARLFPPVADNRYSGRRLGLWLFGLMPVKVLMGLNVIVNTSKVAESADGVPIGSCCTSPAR